MAFQKTTDIIKRIVGTTAILKFYNGSQLIWQQGNAPSITALTAVPSSIDLDTRPSGTVLLTFAVSGSTHNRLYNKRTGANIPLTSNTTARFTQPQQPTTYSLVAQNATGASHRDVTIDVTKNPTVTNLRRVGFQQIPLGGGSANYRFAMTVTGLPRPAVSYRFGDGQRGNIVSNLFRQGANPFTWTIEFTITRANADDTSLTVTATNASATVTATLSDINASN